MIATLRRRARKILDEVNLPATARAVRRADRRGLPAADPGIERAVAEGIAWLCRAQDRTASRDGGVARDYSLVDGWATSYPETTGYIVPTILDHAERTGDDALRARGRRMLDWLVSIQMEGGGFQGGRIDSKPVVPVTFNTGQILMGLARCARDWPDYVEPMRRAADWLTETQDPDGCWRRFPTPFAKPGEKAYETHVAWGLMEAARIMPDTPWSAAALRNVDWALGRQRPNGWFESNCLSDPAAPLTHTIGYVLRGVVEAWLFSGEERYLAAARRTADGLVPAIADDGRLAGRLDSGWRGTVDYVCLTGSVQIAHSLLLLHRDTGESRYRDAGLALNAFVRRTIAVDGPDEIRGGVKGSFPVDGGYGTWEYLNWACKFAIDSFLVEAAPAPVAAAPAPAA